MKDILNKIKINEKNPRFIKKESFEKLKNKILGFPEMLEKRPIIYDEDFIVLGGNMRLRALQELAKGGFVVKNEYFRQVTDWSNEQKRKFVILDNLADGEWDFNVLESEWKDLDLLGWGLGTHDLININSKTAGQLWTGMPEFVPANNEINNELVVHFQDDLARAEFAGLVKQTITKDTKYIYYPLKKKRNIKRYSIKSNLGLGPRYKIYIISKGRWKSRLTVRSLEKIGVDFFVVIEPQEYENYASVIDKRKILVLPFSNLGQGSIPARNWVWEHSIKLGAEKHWILDDNIRGFYRSYKQVRIPVADGTIFRCCEDFVDRFSNVPMSGMNYCSFGFNRISPFQPNTRIYSCILLDNNYSFRWRGKYNEDTDLSLRFLKAGYCTILFNAFLAGKIATMTMKGGNTESLYKLRKEDGRLLMAKSLKDQHGDVVRVVRKWGRWQHLVNYKPFLKNKFAIKKNLLFDIINKEYGMRLYKDNKLFNVDNLLGNDFF